jgi:hypothetical protein
MSELTAAGLVVGVEAEECNKIIRVQAVQVKGEMEEPKEAAVNKREGMVNNAANLKGTYVVMRENER